MKNSPKELNFLNSIVLTAEDAKKIQQKAKEIPESCAEFEKILANAFNKIENASKNSLDYCLVKTSRFWWPKAKKRQSSAFIYKRLKSLGYDVEIALSINDVSGIPITLSLHVTW